MNSRLLRPSHLVAVLVAALIAPVVARAAEISPLMLGSAWYPEQWPEAQWESDLSLMQAAGFRMVRIGEFAWSTFEPAEGKFELDWMERAIAAAAAHGIVTVIGTPTDAPPAWLTSKYPETLRIAEGGQQMEHGMRRQFSYSSAKYRELCRLVVEQLAKRFGHNPNVVAWQIDNEYTEDSFDAESRGLFHHWLQEKYGSLDQLNKQWMTAYWSQTYSAWDQIPMNTGRNNPGLLLDYKRFVTDEWRGFQRNQVEVLRRHVEPRQLITTNLGGLGWANRFNRREIAGDLDIIGWDPYVGQGHFDFQRIGATHDLVRGWKRQNFWVLEMQPGFVDWAGISNSLNQGETRAMMWNAVGHGADCVAFWQWRAGLNGQEQYHGVLVGADGQPVPVYREIAQAGGEFQKVGAALAGTSPQSQVAILHDYDSRWSIDFHKQTNRWDNVDVLLSYYRPLRELTQSVDIVDPTFSLDRYKLVVAPGLIVLSPELAKHLAAYVEQGGHLVLGPRSGMMNEFNALNPERQPGPLVPTLGGRVEQFYALLDDAPVAGKWGAGSATIWAEMLSAKAPDAEVIMRYGASNGFLDGQPAVITRPVGRGRITYVGALFDAKLTRAMTADLLKSSGVATAPFIVPEGVEVCRRVGAGRTVLVVLNFSAAAQTIALPRPMHDLLAGTETSRFELPRYGVAVLSENQISP